MPQLPESRRNLTLRASTDAELDAASVISVEDQRRIAARFRETTVPQMRRLLDGPVITDAG